MSSAPASVGPANSGGHFPHECAILSLESAHGQPQIAVENTETAYPCFEDSCTPTSCPGNHSSVSDGKSSESVTEEFPISDGAQSPHFSGQPAPNCGETLQEILDYLEIREDCWVSSPGEPVSDPQAVAADRLECTNDPTPAEFWDSLDEFWEDFCQLTQI